ncbi:MAG: hypothetical protein B7Z78_13450 [Rhodospirillales bacterium 20-60-12]|nr:MAG: hypothetical protein B7Z78_13450 [Rhodospirillales bacterium 20-60-12]
MGALEERLNPSRFGQQVEGVRVEKHRAGEVCHHWQRGPSGRMIHGERQLCVLCYGTGKLVVDVNLRFHKTKGMQHSYYPAELPDTEYMPSSARRPYEAPSRPRQVA